MRLDDPRATILNQPSKLGPGSVIMLLAQSTRSQAFWLSMLNLLTDLPPGLARTRSYIGSDVTSLRNQAVRDFLVTDGEWMWFIDDDHGFKSDILVTLLLRLTSGFDVVGPLCLRRVAPFLPTATDLDGDHVNLLSCPKEGLIEVMQTGSSGLLVRRSVFEAIEDPWFVPRAGVSEDVGFCEKVREADFKIHIDLSVPLAHETNALLWPTWDEERGVWMTGVQVANGSANLLMGQMDPDDVAAAQAEEEAVEAPS